MAQSEIQKNKIVKFTYNTGSGNISFMTYGLNNQTQVRADICVPYRSEDYALQDDTLVCNTCCTVYSAQTGIGMSGACVNHTKASVAYSVVDGNLVLKTRTLLKHTSTRLSRGNNQMSFRIKFPPL